MKENWQWCNIGGKYCGARFITWAGSGQLCYGDVNPERTSTCDPINTPVKDEKLLDEIKITVVKHFDEKKKQLDVNNESNC